MALRIVRKRLNTEPSGENCRGDDQDDYRYQNRRPKRLHDESISLRPPPGSESNERMIEIWPIGSIRFIPAHPRILVQSLSLNLPSVPENSAYADLVVLENRVDLLGRVYEAIALIFVNNIRASSSEHPIRVENSPRKSIPLQTSFRALLMMRSSSDVNSTSIAVILPEQIRDLPRAAVRPKCELRDRLVFQQMPSQDGDLLFRRVVLPLLLHSFSPLP